jgi:hypothetical protein
MLEGKIAVPEAPDEFADSISTGTENRRKPLRTRAR